MKKIFTNLYCYLSFLLFISIFHINLNAFPVGSGIFSLSVLNPPVIISPDGGQSFCQGSIQNITWSSTGITNVAIFLSSDGGNNFNDELVASTPASTGSWLWNIPPNQAVGSNYKIKIADASDNSVNDVSTGTFSIKLVTQIINDPQSLDICEGQKATFSVTATGENLEYQWRKGGVNIPNAHGSTYTIDKLVGTDAGQYDVVVRGDCLPQATSSPANLNVIMMPRITKDIQDQSAVIGTQVIFEVTATGDNLTYRWRKDKNELFAGNTNIYTIENVVMEDAGHYDCEIYNECNLITTFSANLKVLSDQGPVLTVTKNEITFDTVMVSDNKTIIAKNLIKNTGKKELEISVVNLNGTDASEFTLLGSPSNILVSPDSTFTLQISFHPQTPGNKTASISFQSNSDSIAPYVQLSGFGGLLSVSCDKLLDFGEIMVSPTVKKLMVRNDGNLPVHLTNLNIINDPKSVFTVTKPALPYTIKGNGNLEISITFQSSTWDSYTSNIELNITELTSPINVELKVVFIKSSVDEPNEVLNTFIAYPNPMKDNIGFSSKNETLTNLKFEIVDLLGNIIYSTNNIQNSGQGIHIDWNGRDLNNNLCQNGFYFAILRFNGSNKIIPIIINK